MSFVASNLSANVRFWSLLSRPIRWSGKRESDGTQVPKLQGQPRTLADGLMLAGLCDETAVNRAWVAAQKTGKRFEDSLTRLSVVTEQSLAEISANILKLPLAKTHDFPAFPVLETELRLCFLRQAGCCPLRICDGELILGIIDGFDDFIPKAISAKTGLNVSLMIVLPVDLEAAFSRLYSSQEASKDDLMTSFSSSEEDLTLLEDDSAAAFVIKRVEAIITAAVESGASDIHFESCEDRLCVRYRHDGILVDIEAIPRGLAAYVISRTKVMAQLDIAEKRLPQDGRFKLSIRGNEVNFRLSTMPSLHGEKAVIRILDKNHVPLDFAELGLGKPFIKRWTECLSSENGILLVVGPTGSGKSTTIYTSLQKISTGQTNIVTIEDPIECRLSGINQSQTKPQIGLTFASALRSLLRQDPDVIMVGEIRDLETAEIAVQAAMTGHLVLSTLHTNSAAAAFIRLRDIGLEPYAIASVVRGIAAQRLLKKLCVCKRLSQSPVNLTEFFGTAAGESCDLLKLWEPVGCVKCRGTGYNGRFAVAELIVPDKALKALIARGASQDELEATLKVNGMRRLFDIAQESVSKGLTGLDEVVRLYEAA